MRRTTKQNLIAAATVGAFVTTGIPLVEAFFLWYGWSGWTEALLVVKTRLATGFLVGAVLFPICQFLLYGERARRMELLPGRPITFRPALPAKRSPSES